MAFLIHTKDIILGITLNTMYKFIHFRKASNMLVSCYSVKGQQIVLRSLPIIPPFMLLGWHDAMWMTGCHFKVTITLNTRFHNYMGASILNFLKENPSSHAPLQTLVIKCRNMQYAFMEQHRSARTFASIYLPLAPSVIETALPPVDIDMEACSLSDILPLRFLFFYLSTLPSVFFYNPSLTLDISHHFSTS